MDVKRKVVLTDAQFQFLANLVLHGPQTAVEYYAPASKLFEFGFATRVMGSFTYTYTATESGRVHHQKISMADVRSPRGRAAPR
jgi:hypothetical protein